MFTRAVVHRLMTRAPLLRRSAPDRRQVSTTFARGAMPMGTMCQASSASTGQEGRMKALPKHMHMHRFMTAIILTAAVLHGGPASIDAQ